MTEEQAVPRCPACGLPATGGCNPAAEVCVNRGLSAARCPECGAVSCDGGWGCPGPREIDDVPPNAGSAS